MPEWIRNIPGFIVFLFAFALIVLPYPLVIIYPDSGSNIVAISRYAIPWLVIFILVLAFNEGIEEIFLSFGRAIDRIKRLSAGSAAADLGPHQPAAASTVGEVNTSAPNLFDGQTAVRFFLLYVYNTIYGSQLELLKRLFEEGDASLSVAADYFANFKTQLEDDREYKFEEWMNFLTDNRLLQRDPDNDKLKITEPGRLFVSAVKNEKNPRVFRY